MISETLIGERDLLPFLGTNDEEFEEEEDKDETFCFRPRRQRSVEADSTLGGFKGLIFPPSKSSSAESEAFSRFPLKLNSKSSSSTSRCCWVLFVSSTLKTLFGDEEEGLVGALKKLLLLVPNL